GDPGLGVEDDFFANGGDSISGFQVLARVRQALGVPVASRALFDAPTIARFAALLPDTPSTVDNEAIPVDAAGGPAPLAPAQRRLWLLEDLTGGDTGYNTGVAVRLTG